MDPRTTRRAWLLVALGLLASLAACGGGEPEATPAAEATPMPTPAPVVEVTPTPEVSIEPAAVVESDLLYATRVSDGAPVTLDLHVPVEADGAPIVIGAKSVVDRLVEAGAMVVTFHEDDHLGPGPSGPEEVLSDRAFMRAEAERHACAIRLARARASQLGSGDPVVLITGLSLGGGVAAHVALFGDTLEARWDEFAAAGGPPRQWDCAVTDGSTHVDAVVGMAGTYDLYVPILDGTYGRAYQQEHDPELQAFLASPLGANPALKVRLIHGTLDEIPVAYAAEFAELLTDAGYDAQLATFVGGHVEPPPELLLSTVTEVLEL